jgi:GxxExxY protein
MGKRPMKDIARTVIGCAFKVQNTLGPGFLEKVYENASAIEVRKAGLDVKQQIPIAVFYREQAVGEYVADLLVEDCLIIEIKSVRKLVAEHEVQLVNYLTATGINDGLLINFGPSVEIRHKYRNFQKNSIFLLKKSC